MLITYTLRWLKRHYIVSIIIGLALLLILCLIAQMILSSYDVFPEKKRAEELARKQISEELKESGYTLIDLEIHSSDAKKFTSSEEDMYGYFDYINRDISFKDADGTEYRNHMHYLKSQGIDPKQSKKWGYTLKGTCVALKEAEPPVEINFIVAIVEECKAGGNHWLCTLCKTYSKTQQ